MTVCATSVVFHIMNNIWAWIGRYATIHLRFWSNPHKDATPLTIIGREIAILSTAACDSSPSSWIWNAIFKYVNKFLSHLSIVINDSWTYLGRLTSKYIRSTTSTALFTPSNGARKKQISNRKLLKMLAFAVYPNFSKLTRQEHL